MKKSIFMARGMRLVVAMTIGCLAIFASSAVNAAVNKRVELVAGKASTINLGEAVSDVLVANPSVVDVGILRSDRLFLVGKGIGDTNVLAFDAEGNQLADISVHVKVDQQSLASAMTEFFPNENIEVRTVNSNIVLSGVASTPLAANRIRDLASRFVTTQGQSIVDLMGVKGEQQVMLQVKVMEARRSVLREYGIETDFQPGNLAARDGGFINSIGGVGLTALEPFANGSILFDDNGGFGPLRLSLQALERDGLINTLAEPNLTAISGETAGFLAGGEFPVPTGTTDNGNTITIEFKQFGVSLNFTPTVLTEDNISLHLATEVSALAEDQGLTLTGVDIPGLTVRRAETTVEMSSGGSIMIAGLIQSGSVDAFNGLPGISQVPILGELFKSKSFQRDESELIIMVTPYLVKPFAAPRAEMAAASPVMPVPSPLPNDLKPAYQGQVVAPEKPVAPAQAMPSKLRQNNGEQRTQGVGVPVTPQGRRHSTPASETHLPAIAPRQTAVQPPAPQVPIAAQSAPVMPAAPVEAVAAAVPEAKPSPLSQHLARSLRSTYGAKADNALHQNQAYGYLVD